MKNKAIIIFAILSILLVSSLCAESVYYWKDKKGVTHISTTPPPDNVNNYDTHGMQKDSPEEIERFNRQRQQRIDAEEARSKDIRRANESKVKAKSPSPASAEKGVIVSMTRKCFIIETTGGYVIVNGWVSAHEGDTVIGEFNKFGSTKIYNTNGNEISGYAYIEDYLLSKSGLKNKWNRQYRAKCE